MIRIYLDWNVFSILKSPTHPLHATLTEKLNKHRDLLVIPYSPAHIQDLEKGWDGTPEKEAFTRNDLRFISYVTGDYFFVQYWKEQYVKCHFRNPEEYFDSTRETEKESLADIMNFDKIFEGLDLDEEQLATIEEPLKKMREARIEFENYPGEEELKKYDTLFPVPRNGQLWMDYFKQFAVYMDSFMNDPKKYKEVRDTFQRVLGIDPGVISNWNTNTAKKLDEFLPTTALGITFTEHLKKTSSKKKPTGNKLYDELQEFYIGLDQMGFHNESISKKNTFQNFNNDSLHAYYAAHCDIFLTCDGNTTYKSKASYEKFDVNTVVQHPKEFIETIDAFIEESKDKNRLLKTLTDLIAKDFSAVKVFSRANNMQTKSHEIMFELNEKAVGYFNLGVHIANNRIKFVELHKSRGLHCKFVLYKEIGSMVNMLMEMLGPGLHGKGKFQPEVEIAELEAGTWEGRGWAIENHFVALQYSKNSFKLALLPK